MLATTHIKQEITQFKLTKLSTYSDGKESLSAQISMALENLLFLKIYITEVIG